MRESRAIPRIWDTDWLVLRALVRLLREQASAHVRPGTLMVDLGCGDMPYADMMLQMEIDYRGADIGDGGSLKIDEQGRVPLADGAAGAVLSVQVLESMCATLTPIAPRFGGCCATMVCCCCPLTAPGSIIPIQKTIAAGHARDLSWISLIAGLKWKRYMRSSGRWQPRR